MKSIKELLAQLKQKEFTFATKQWIIIIVSVVIGVCLSDYDDYLYRNNDASRWIDSGWIIKGHHIDGMFRGLSFALVVVGMNIIYRFFKKREYVYREHKTWTLRQIMLESLKYIGVIGLIFMTLILWVTLSFTMQPLSMFITIYLVYTIIHALLKHEKWWYWSVAILVFAVVGAWYVFNNDIEGPTLWRISDDIVDTPGQWLDCYRFYWCGRVIHDTSLLGGLISFIILILMKLVREIYTQCKKKKSPKINEPKPRLDHSLERFVVAQERMYPRALEEVKNGRKVTHWIWYIFPQLKGLGHSNKSIYYGLDGIEEARAYLAHPVLGARLREITTAVLQSDKSADEIFGGIDTIKLRSCMTLFNEVAEDDLFGRVLLKCFEGKEDKKTMMIASPEVKIDCLLGAIAGDVIGSVYEFRTFKGTSFPLFCDYSEYTDDSVMTVANADWLLSGDSLLGIMQEYGHRYPTAGYGGMFKDWLWSDDPQPYNSWGNGSAMRVSPVGWAFDTLEEILEAAKQSAEITHNHPEGIKGAQATSACIYLARTGKSKEYIKEYVETTFGYNLSRTCDEIRPVYQFDGSCQGTVPESIIAFLESTDYESAIRLTVSLGGDADTMGAITGAIAEAYYGGVPEHIKQEVLKRLPDEFVDVMNRFYKRFVER